MDLDDVLVILLAGIGFEPDEPLIGPISEDALRTETEADHGGPAPT